MLPSTKSATRRIVALVILFGITATAKPVRCDDEGGTTVLTRAQRQQIAANVKVINILVLTEVTSNLSADLRERLVRDTGGILSKLQGLNLTELGGKKEAITLTLRLGVSTYKSSGPYWVVGTTTSAVGQPATVTSIPTDEAANALWKSLGSSIMNRHFERGALNRIYVICDFAQAISVPAGVSAKARSRFVAVHFLICNGPEGDDSIVRKQAAAKLAGFGGSTRWMSMTTDDVVDAITDDVLERAKGIPIELHLIQSTLSNTEASEAAK